MERIRLYIASALFILLTAIKLLFPAQMDVLRRGAERIAGTDRDYTATVATIGRGLSDRELGEKLVAVWRDYTEVEAGRE